MHGLIDQEVAAARMQRLLKVIADSGRSFDTILIVDKINQFYFTGTMQDALLVIRANGTYGYFVRRSYERAAAESGLCNIQPMNSYRDLLKYLPPDLGNVLLEASIMPLAMLQRLQRVFSLGKIDSVESYIMKLRMIKDFDELALISAAGEAQNRLLREIVPTLMREGMSEAELMADVYAAMIRGGHHGVSRFSMFQLDMVAGQLGFGENALYPTCFDGPGGMLGMSPAVPAVGSRERLLKRGDLVFLDIGFGIDGYHSDKTQVYSFGSSPSDEVVSVHTACINILDKVAARLRPGEVPAEIYADIMADLPSQLSENFMGMGAGQVKFLGHGVGLQIDEPPVLANGFTEPLAANMVLAVEPKRGIAGIGMTGVEETFIVTEESPRCITGGACDIIRV